MRSRRFVHLVLVALLALAAAHPSLAAQVRCFEIPRAKVVEALASTSFAIDPEEIVKVIGEAGAGKSALLNICGPLEEPVGGMINDGETNFSAIGLGLGSELTPETLFKQLSGLPGKSGPVLLAVGSEEIFAFRRLLAKVGGGAGGPSAGRGAGGQDTPVTGADTAVAASEMVASAAGAEAEEEPIPEGPLEFDTIMLQYRSLILNCGELRTMAVAAARLLDDLPDVAPGLRSALVVLLSCQEPNGFEKF